MFLPAPLASRFDIQNSIGDYSSGVYAQGLSYAFEHAEQVFDRPFKVPEVIANANLIDFIPEENIAVVSIDKQDKRMDKDGKEESFSRYAVYAV